MPTAGKEDCKSIIKKNLLVCISDILEYWVYNMPCIIWLAEMKCFVYFFFRVFLKDRIKKNVKKIFCEGQGGSLWLTD